MFKKKPTLREGRSKTDSKKKSGWKPKQSEVLRLSNKPVDIILCPAEYTNTYVDYDTGQAEEVVETWWSDMFRKVKTKWGSFPLYRVGWDADKREGTVLEEQYLRLREDGPVGKLSRQYYFNVIHFDLFELRDLLDRDGKLQSFSSGDKEGETIQSWQPIESVKGRKQVRANIEDLVEDDVIRLWKKRYINTGPMHHRHLKSIMAIADTHCKCGGHLEAVAYECEECGHVLADIEDDKEDWTHEDFLEFGEGPRRCSDCRHRGLPRKVSECDSCSDPSALGFWEIVLTIKKEGRGVDSYIKIDKAVPVSQYLMGGAYPLVEFSDEDEGDEEPLVDSDGDLVFTEELLKPLTNGFNFDELGYNRFKDEDWLSKQLGLKEGDPGYVPYDDDDRRGGGRRGGGRGGRGSKGFR